MEALYAIIGAGATLIVGLAAILLKRRFIKQDSNDAAKSQLEIFNTGKLFGRVEKLEADIERLRTTIMTLTTKNVELTFENKQLKEENIALKADNKELHDKIEKLEQQVQQLIDMAGHDPLEVKLVE